MRPTLETDRVTGSIPASFERLGAVGATNTSDLWG
jgi:hypothetical protein